MTSWTLRFIFEHPPKQWPTGRKEGRTEIQKFEYLEDEKSFFAMMVANNPFYLFGLFFRTKILKA